MIPLVCPETDALKAFIPKKILLMGHSDGQGGAQTAFKMLSSFTSAEGHKVKLIVLSNSGLIKQPFQRRELMGRIAFTGPRFMLLIKKALGLVNVVFKTWRFQPDIFVCVGLNNSSNLIAGITGKRCFKAGQDFIANRSVSDPVWLSSRKVMDGIVVQAPSMLNHWKNLEVNTTAINWLPCFPEQPAAGVLKLPKDPADKKIKLGYFGRLAGNKGLDLLLAALADPNTPGNVVLDLWGEGLEEAALKQLTITLGLQSVVRFLGRYPSGKDGAMLIASYDAIVLCSTGMEGLPLILLESMAYGVPILATDVGAITDCCTGNPDAVLVSPTKESIAKGINQLVLKIETSYFNSCRQKAFYDSTFSYMVMAARWREFYNNPKGFFHAE